MILKAFKIRRITRELAELEELMAEELEMANEAGEKYERLRIDGLGDSREALHARMIHITCMRSAGEISAESHVPRVLELLRLKGRDKDADELSADLAVIDLSHDFETLLDPGNG
jgi:hypothetical protein